MQVLSPDLIRLQERLLALSRPNFTALLNQIGGLVESETRNRIANEKTAPDGSAWRPWSAEYAKTRHEGQSLLESTGALVDSITNDVTGDELEVGSNLIYANHQDSMRRFLGFSSANETQIVHVVEKYLGDLLSGKTEAAERAKSESHLRGWATRRGGK